jgi:hypothetical protein
VDDLSRTAAFNGSSEVLIWARAVAGAHRWYHAQWNRGLCYVAAAGNQLATLQWLCAEATGKAGLIDDDLWIKGGVGARAAQYADVAMLQWICTQYGGQWDEMQVLSICYGAVQAATTMQLHWLRTHYAQHNLISDNLAFTAVAHGTVASLQWLAAAGFAYTDAEYTDHASLHNDFETLRYLIEVAGCPWDRDVVPSQAIDSATGDVLDWLQNANGQPWSTATLTQLLLEAGQCDNLDAAKWLRGQGAEWPDNFLLSRSHYPTQQLPVDLRLMQ